MKSLNAHKNDYAPVLFRCLLTLAALRYSVVSEFVRRQEPSMELSQRYTNTSASLILLFFIVVLCIPMHAQNSAIGIFEGQSDVGSVVPPGTAIYDSAQRTYTINAAGANLWSTADAFHYLWKKMSGDLSLTADINFPVTTGTHDPHRKAFLIIRQDLSPDSVYADVALHGAGLTALQYRPEKGAITQDVELNLTVAPRKLRLEKRGDVMTMFLSLNGEPLHQVGASRSVRLEGPFYVGIGVCAHNKDAVEKAVFSNIELQPLTTPATPASLVLYSTLQTITLDGRASIVYSAQGHLEAPNWSRDGKTLFFNQDGQIKKIPVEGGTPEVLDTGGATKCNGSHGLSPDGNWMAISCNMPDKPQARVYIIPSSGGTPRQVTEHPASYFHGWSPDGKTIAFVRPENGAFNIMAIPIEGGQEVALTTGQGVSDDPDYSADGKYIYFNSNRVGTSMQIWRMHADGSSPEQVTFDDQNNWTAHPSPDGKVVAFYSYGPGVTGHPTNRDISIRLLSLEDNQIRTLVKIVGGAGTMNVPSWSPDSKSFAFVSYQMLPANDTGSTQ
jgi:TolB protein